MTSHKQPSKETVRQWLRAQIARRGPPPAPDQIRRDLGWKPGGEAGLPASGKRPMKR